MDNITFTTTVIYFFAAIVSNNFSDKAIDNAIVITFDEADKYAALNNVRTFAKATGLDVKVKRGSDQSHIATIPWPQG